MAGARASFESVRLEPFERYRLLMQTADLVLANREALTDDQYFNTDPEISPNDPQIVAYSSYRGDHLILDDQELAPGELADTQRSGEGA